MRRYAHLTSSNEAYDAVPNSTQAEALVVGSDFERLLADKADDVAAFVQQLVALGVEVVIPPIANRLEQSEYDKHWYKERHLIECFINKIKHYRRIFSRFEKYAKRYIGFLSFVSALIWLH